MPIHPSMNNYDNTLANAVCHYYQTQGIPYTFRCVNRLDRDTTGLTILAKHLISSAILNSEVSVRGISREYLAIVKGFTEDEGTVNAPIGRKEGSTIERQIDVLHGETAITHYKRLAYQDGLSLISLKLETGRTHQIRVHMKSIGHPLIGDFYTILIYKDKQTGSALLPASFHPPGHKETTGVHCSFAGRYAGSFS